MEKTIRILAIVLGIQVLDHIIVGRHSYMSFADEGLLDHGR